MSKQHEAAAHDKALFGFWAYLMTDVVLFASLFATYAVLRQGTYGGPDASELFEMPFVLVETLLLLTSSFTVGIALVGGLRGASKRFVLSWLALTGLLGLGFLGMELYEFNHLVQDGHGWQASAFLSAFFTLVGTHGAHITVGLIWLTVLVSQIVRHGLATHTLRRLAMFSLFWHFLDVVWIFIFTIVYMFGVLSL